MVFVIDEAKMNEMLFELKTWLFSCSYPQELQKKLFFKSKHKGPAPKNEDIVIPCVSTHFSNFDSKSISVTANSLLSNMEDNKLKKHLANVK